jgi:hypothetical protein
LSGNLQGVCLASARHQDDVLIPSLAAKEPDALDELCQSLFALTTEFVISHKSDDWPRYYDRVGALVCRVVAQSPLDAKSKAVLTRRLVHHVVELEKWWPRLKPE